MFFIIIISVKNSRSMSYVLVTMIHYHSNFWGKKEINAFIQQWRIKLIQSDSKDINNVARDFK